MTKLRIIGDGDDERIEAHQAEWLPLLSDYIDGDLSADDTKRLQDHLADCLACTADLAGLRQVVGALHQLPAMMVPRSFTLTPAQARRLKPAPLYRFSQAAAAIAAAFLLFVSILDLAGSFNSPVKPNIQALQTAAPTTDDAGGIPTLRPADTKASGGSLVGSSADVTSSPTVAATPQPVSAAISSDSSSSSGIRWLELSLALATILFVVFAFAVRPRAPGRLRS